jgi:hypothetical protein
MRFIVNSEVKENNQAAANREKPTSVPAPGDSEVVTKRRLRPEGEAV